MIYSLEIRLGLNLFLTFGLGLLFMRSFYYINTRTEKCSFKKNLSRERETRDHVFFREIGDEDEQ